MKFQKLILGTLLLGMGLTSCNLNSDEGDNYQSFNYSVCNLVTPLSGGNSFATFDTYNLVYYIYAGNVTVTSTSLSLGIGTTSFTTAPMPYTVQAYGTIQNYLEVTKFNGGQALGNGATISNLSGFTSQWLNFLPSETVPMIKYPVNYTPALVISYLAEYDYNVRTFSPDAIYGGSTSVSIVGAPMPPYTSDGVYYRVIFHNDLKQADVIFYNAKFAEMMPALNFVVRNLDVVYNRSGYSIQIPAGQYIVPEMQSGQSGTLLPFEKYRFTSFNLVPTSTDLTNAMITYNIDQIDPEVDLNTAVASFNCSFQGAYVYSEPKQAQ